MIEKDFIKREIDQLGITLRKILSELVGLKDNGNSTQGIEISQLALQSKLDIDVNELKNLPKKTLINFLTKQKKLENNSLGTLSQILFEISRKNEDKDMAQMTLNILEHLEQSESTYSFERQEQINILKQVIDAV